MGLEKSRMKLTNNRLFKHLRNVRLMIAFFILLTVIFTAIFAPFLAPHNPNAQNLRAALRPPVWKEGGSWDFILGTDNLGRDILSRIIYGARVSTIVGLSAMVLSGTIGIILGLMAGYFGGWLDSLIMRIADIFLSFPIIILAIGIIAAVGGGLINIIVVLGIVRWVPYARVVRGQVLAIREKEFVQAAEALGVPTYRILFLHILPNTISPVIVVAAFMVAMNITTEASLSFLGLGVEPRIVTWGTMLSTGRAYLHVAWWLAIFPGLAIMFTVLSINLFGDWLRDFMDPTSVVKSNSRL